MEPRRRAFITLIVLMVLIFGLYFFTNWFSLITGYTLGEDEKLKLAHCLNDKNSIFYISSTCPQCESQLELFGEASSLIETYLCVNVQNCPAQSVPAWKINGQFYYGKKSLNELVRISACDLKTNL